MPSSKYISGAMVLIISALTLAVVSFALMHVISRPSKKEEPANSSPKVESNDTTSKWCEYRSLRGAYTIKYPCDWTVEGTSEDVSIYLSPNVQAGFGISI